MTLPDYKDTILLIPSVSIANIPQLALDLLLHTVPFTKTATLSSKYLHPFVSPVDHVETPKKGVSYGLEAYVCKEKKLTLLQQRSPVLPGCAKAMVAEVLVPFIEQGQFSHVIFLDSLDAGLAKEFFPGQIKVYTSEDFLSSSLRQLQISSNVEPLNSEICSSYGKIFVESVSKITTLSALVTHAYEGDNFYDAHVMASKVSELLELGITQWQVPVSWSGVYGDKPVPSALEDGLYG